MRIFSQARLDRGTTYGVRIKQQRKQQLKGVFLAEMRKDEEIGVSTYLGRTV